MRRRAFSTRASIVVAAAAGSNTGSQEVFEALAGRSSEPRIETCGEPRDARLVVIEVSVRRHVGRMRLEPPAAELRNHAIFPRASRFTVALEPGVVLTITERREFRVTTDAVLDGTSPARPSNSSHPVELEAPRRDRHRWGSGHRHNRHGEQCMPDSLRRFHTRLSPGNVSTFDLVEDAAFRHASSSSVHES